MRYQIIQTPNNQVNRTCRKRQAGYLGRSASSVCAVAHDATNVDAHVAKAALHPAAVRAFDQVAFVVVVAAGGAFRFLLFAHFSFLLWFRCRQPPNPAVHTDSPIRPARR